MNEDLRNLYVSLGYAGPLPQKDVNPLDTAIESVSVSTLLHEGQPVSAEIAGPGAERIVGRTDSAEIPPLGPDGLNELEAELNRDPEATLARTREVLDEDMTEAGLRSVISRARMALRSPETAVIAIEAEADHLESASPLPAGFNFTGMDVDEIPINPGDRKFETIGDALGWVINAGPFILNRPPRNRFRWHSHPDYLASKFVYPLDEPSQDSPVEVALFSDFGNGRYHALYIAKQLREKRFPFAIHLGDVYYAGRRSEFENYFAAPLDPLLSDTQLFALNSNHEMYSAGVPYYEFMDKRRSAHPEKQKQEGSYFCLRSSKFQIVGIDTAYFGQGRYKDPDLLEWLTKTLDDGRRAGLVNILLSADQPYEYGSTKQTKLLREDLDTLVFTDHLVDLWFWGNTHYCALFDRTIEIPFIGSCIGHAGYPYDRQRLGKSAPAPIRFLETAARFPEWTGVRQDMGNNGYCVIALKADGSLDLRYIDWMSRQRCKATMSKIGDNDHLSVVSVKIGE